MGRYQRTNASQGNTMEQYTPPVPLPQPNANPRGSEDSESVATTAEDPSRSEILAAIQGLRVALEGKIETVAVEMAGDVGQGHFGQLGKDRWSGSYDGPDWRTRGGRLLEGTVAQGSAVEPALRIEIPQDGTMAVESAGSADGSGVQLELGSEMVPAQVLLCRRHLELTVVPVSE
ncbi:hypothetical protein NDU88_001193 [Pleurodeles waltl]|uniref:Uncharacterized protein n=1 Tax=Pleurodeles waltl TaxID=8319 RepID=A0AAV7WHM0_PLEWA|nr:hypothetical protein NDU88_001193 [Pleurodeles waltl]